MIPEGLEWNQLNARQQNDFLARDRRDRIKQKNEKITTLLDELFNDDEDDPDYDVKLSPSGNNNLVDQGAKKGNNYSTVMNPNMKVQIGESQKWPNNLEFPHLKVPSSNYSLYLKLARSFFFKKVGHFRYNPCTCLFHGLKRYFLTRSFKFSIRTLQ